MQEKCRCKFHKMSGDEPTRLDINITHHHIIEAPKEAIKVNVEVDHKIAELDHKIQIKTDQIINFDKYALLMMIAAIPIYYFGKGKYVK